MFRASNRRMIPAIFSPTSPTMIRRSGERVVVGIALIETDRADGVVERAVVLAEVVHRLADRDPREWLAGVGRDGAIRRDKDRIPPAPARVAAAELHRTIVRETDP